MSPEFLGLSRVDFITVGAVGPPGGRTFYLQAGQGDLVVSVIIEKEHAAALALGIQQMLQQLSDHPVDEWLPTDLELREPIEPMFRVGRLGLGYDPDEGVLILVVGALSDEDDPPEVHLWCSWAQMAALAQRAADVVAAGRPRCPICDEALEPDQRHVCARGNGRKWLYRVER
mgnify:CR=1 FL=1